MRAAAFNAISLHSFPYGVCLSPYILLPSPLFLDLCQKRLTSTLLIRTLICLGLFWLLLLSENVLHPLSVVPVPKSALLAWLCYLPVFFCPSQIGHSVGTECLVLINFDKRV